MYKLILPLACVAVLFANIARGDDLPFFSSLREEIASQLTIASNTVPLDKKLLASLRSNLKIVDKTKPTLIAGSGALGTLAKGLGKTSLSNAFLPILTGIRTVYIDTMETQMDGLADRLADTIPGKAQTSAQTALDKAATAIDAVGTNSNFALSLKALSTAAKALAAAEKSVAKAETAKPGPNFITATITETDQGTTALKPLKGTLEAFYDDFDGTIEIDVAELTKLSGGRVQTRMLEITAEVPDEGAYELSLTDEAVAWYQRIVSPSFAEFEEEEPDFEFYENFFTIDPFNQTLGTGTLTITVDFEANIVWGTCSFTAGGSENAGLEATVTGSFLVRLSTYEEF
jgi:hypothetical protein